MKTTELRELVESRVNQRWESFARAHPHLAQAIDRTRLIESSVERLREDPAFSEALRRASSDGDKLGAAARVIDLVEGLIGRVMRL